MLYGEDQLMQAIELHLMDILNRQSPWRCMCSYPKDPTTFSNVKPLFQQTILSSLWGTLQPQKATIGFPRFQIQGDFSLPETLQALGMTDAFSLPPADFSGITGQSGSLHF